MSDTTPAACIATILEQICSALTQVEAESDVEERDVVVKKLISALVNTASVLLEVPVHSAETNNVSSIVKNSSPGVYILGL